MVYKIVLIGPESTGKTTLAEQLAEHYQGVYCTEYARTYLQQNTKPYTYNNLLTIAKQQLLLEQQCTQQLVELAQHTSKCQYLFIDTDMQVMQVWCEWVFNDCHQFILDQKASRHYHLYLLCAPDIAWQKDILREYPDLQTRLALYNIYKNYLENQQTPWTIIKGTGIERVNNAINSINSFLRRR
jgi:nicotinamide riboside kinase